MKLEERIACKYLEQLNLGSPVFEPDGNVSPDFTLHQTAIEVRRLNRSFLNKGKIIISEEDIYINFLQILKDVVRDFNTLYANKSFFIAIDYIAPFKPGKSVKKQLKDKLKDFLNSHPRSMPFRLKINKNITLIIFESQPIEGCVFKFIGSMNYSLSAISELYSENLKICIAEKSLKIKNYRHKYPDWCLLLVDIMEWDLNIDDLDKIKLSVTDLGLFESVVVIDYHANLIFKLKTSS